MKQLLKHIKRYNIHSIYAFSSVGRWVPSPHLLECTLVDCGEPPVVSDATAQILRTSDAISDLQFGAPNSWEHTKKHYLHGWLCIKAAYACVPSRIDCEGFMNVIGFIYKEFSLSECI